MPNKYEQQSDGRWFIIDANTVRHECNVAHPLPLPEGISDEKLPDDGRLFYAIAFSMDYEAGRVWGSSCYPTATHWLARAPLPEVPRPKTQADFDLEAFVKAFPGVSLEQTDDAWGRKVYAHPHVRSTWEGFVAALAYARQQQP